LFAATLNAADTLVANGSQSLAVSADGTVKVWGYRGQGEAGPGSAVVRPAAVAGLRAVVAASASPQFHFLALRRDGAVLAWGWNFYGQLGDGTSIDRATPVAVAKLGSATQVAAGGDFSLALAADGTVWAWGRNQWGQLGDGSIATRLEPVRVSVVHDVRRIAADPPTYAPAGRRRLDLGAPYAEPLRHPPTGADRRRVGDRHRKRRRACAGAPVRRSRARLGPEQRRPPRGRHADAAR
jgi:hypothetical protein